MKAIEIMVKEHDNIKRVLGATRKLCIKLYSGEEIDYGYFYKVMDFVRNYADRHHHSKEEDILFKKMQEETGEEGYGPITGMFAEHDLGRLYMRNLEGALKRVEAGDKEANVDIIANAIAYTDLLYRHIDKENNAIYKFAERSLSQQALKEVEERAGDVEKEATQRGTQEKYIQIMKALESAVD